MLCLMFESDRRGYLQHVTGKPVTAEQLARMTGCSTDEVSQLLQELEDSGVFSRTEHGVIYSRRLVGDEHKRKLCVEAGKKGGNPKLQEWNTLPGFVYAIQRLDGGLIKIGASVNPSDRKNKGVGSLSGGGCRLLRQWPVTVMGEAEKLLHGYFADKCDGGEWFKLVDADLDGIEETLTVNRLLKGQSKGDNKGHTNRNPTPSYSVSNSVSDSELKTKPSVDPGRPAGVVEEIFKYWQAELKHLQSVLDDKRRKVITARIKEGYTKERIMQAIRGIKLSPHNMGQNDRNTKFDDIELICRCGANVDRFADMVPATQPVKTEPPKRTHCDRCGGDGLVSAGRHTYRCPDCRNWEGRYGDFIPFYRTDSQSEGAQ